MDDTIHIILEEYANVRSPFCGIVKINLNFPTQNLQRSFSIPISILNNLLPKKDQIIVDTIDKQVQIKEQTLYIDVPWENSCNILEKLMQPVQYSEIFYKTEKIIQFDLKIADFIQLYCLASLINFEILRYNIEIQIYSFTLETSLYLLSVIEKFYVKGQRLQNLRIPIVEKIVQCFWDRLKNTDINDLIDSLCKNAEIQEIIHSLIFSQPILRLYEESKTKAHQIEEITYFVLNWLANVFGKYVKDQTTFKFEFYRLCTEIKDKIQNSKKPETYKKYLIDLRRFIVWCYSQYNQLIPPIEESIIICKPEMIKYLDPHKILICLNATDIRQCDSSIAPYATLSLCSDGDFEVRDKIFKLLCQNKLIDLSILEPIQLFEILNFAAKEMNTADSEIYSYCFQITSEEIKKHPEYIDLVINSEYINKITQFSYEQLSAAFNLQDQISKDLIFKWMISNRQKITDNMLGDFTNLIGNDAKSPAYLLFAIDQYFSLGIQDKVDSLKEKLNVDIMIAALKVFREEIPEYIFDRKTINLIHNNTFKDHYAHALFLFFLEKSSIRLKKSEIILPVTEITISSALKILSRMSLKHISDIVIDQVVPLSFLMFDKLTDDDLAILAALVVRNKDVITEDLKIMSNDESKIAKFAAALNLPGMVRQSRLPFNIFAICNKLSLVFQFPSYDIPIIIIDQNDWFKFEPARTPILPNSRVLVPISICVFVFCPENENISIQLQIQLLFAGFQEVIVKFVQENNVEIPEASSYAMWLPRDLSNEEPLNFHTEIFNNLKSKPVAISATLVREFPDVYLPNENIRFQDTMQRIDWATISERIIPFKDELFMFGAFSDNIFNSIPFVIQDKQRISEEVSMKCERELAVCFANSTVAVFNFDLVFDKQEGPIFYAASKFTAKILAALLCEATANTSIEFV